MSKTPRTDAACGWPVGHHGRIESSDLVMDIAGPFVHSSVAREVERENAALKQRILDDNKAYGCELMDPSGTIWDHAKRLQQENAALRADKERLDWMEKARPIAWALGSVNCGEYWLLTDIGEKHPEEAEEFATLRAAIDAARKEAQP